MERPRAWRRTQARKRGNDNAVLALKFKPEKNWKLMYTRLLEHKRDIPDDFRYMDPELVVILEDAVKPYLTTWASCANLCHHSRTYKPSSTYESS